ncbi:MAG: hypothetical protein ACYTEQ_16750 [Planctomycetota bacterium]|jgi:hypothetical protein
MSESDKVKKIALLERQMGTLAGYHLECCEMVSRSLMYAGESRRRPIIMIVRGGGYGDNLQACFVAESLRTLYKDAYIILVIRWHAGLMKMLHAAETRLDKRPLIDGWCNTMGVIHHPWFLTPFAGVPDIYIDMLYGPRLVFGNPKDIACPEDAEDEVKAATAQKRRNMERHKTIFEERWKRDEWLRSIHDRSPLSGQDWIKMRTNLLKWQFDCMGLPYVDKITIDPPDISVKMMANNIKPGGYVTFACGARSGKSIPTIGGLSAGMMRVPGWTS